MRILVTLLFSFALQFPAFSDSLSTLEFSDQREQPVVISDNTRVILFSADMGGGDLVKEALNELSITTLSDRNIVYVADISGMPTLITKLFALPKMRDYSYSIALDTDGSRTAAWPRKEDAVTVLMLTNGTITETQFIEQKDQLKTLLTTLSPYHKHQ